MPRKPMARVPLSNKTRFDIFRRDLYTCRYCGKKPPEVTLEIDHIVPISAGGGNELSNLATACLPCNRGKSATELSPEEHVLGDEDQLIQQRLQEILELRDFADAQLGYEMWLDATAGHIQSTFVQIAETSWQPKEQVIIAMIEHYDAPIASSAMRITAQGIRSGKVETSGGAWLKYAWGCARNMVAIPDFESGEDLTESVTE